MKRAQRKRRFYTAWLQFDTFEQVVVQGTTDGQTPPLWTFGEVVSSKDRDRLLSTVHACWLEIGGHVGSNTIADMVTTLELVSLELVFPLVVPGETRAALEGVTVDAVPLAS